MSPAGALRPAPQVSDDDTASFQTVRPRLFGIAYRVLGNAVDADDIVQDAWLRWQRTDRRHVDDPAAFLATTTTRLAINVIQSARVRHEAPIAGELTERVDSGADPALAAIQQDALGRAVRTLLQKLTPGERAVYVLREAFDYPSSVVAQLLSISEANARQLLARARRHLAGDHRRPVDATERHRLLAAFIAAAQTGDLARLERVLVAGMDQSAATATPLPVAS